MQAPQQRRFLHHLLPSLDKVFRSNDRSVFIKRSSALLKAITSSNSTLMEDLAGWLRTPSTSCSTSASTRRAAVASISSEAEHLQMIFEHSLKIFGEATFVRHAPSVQQEACAEVLLLSAGHLCRSQPVAFKFLVRSSTYTQMISSRLNASSDKPRILGMCVGMAISALIDPAGKRLEFDVSDLKTPWAKNLMDTTNVNDVAGSLEDLGASEATSREERTKGDQTDPHYPIAIRDSRKEPTKSAQTQVIGPRIVEVMSDDEDGASKSDIGLRPYAKPDSDQEDSDSDPTLINRDKPKIPVYIRDLIAGLQEQDKYDRHKLALEQAAPLIRRKATFGKEVKDHTTELGLILIGLQDTFELENFIQLRLQALIALLLSDPGKLGPWYARQVFEGDYSLSQRGAILSAIGLSAREMAGHTDIDALNPTVTTKDSFASKRLPSKYHQIYTASSDDSQQQKLPPSSSPLSAITSSITSAIISPLAATALDAETGPSILKTRTFSSRLSAASRTKVISNSLSKVLLDAFFNPLIGSFYTHTSGPSSRARNVYLQPHFLTIYLKTLAILVHASGPSTVSLPSLTTEFWTLLLALRAQAKEDASVMEAVLFGLLALLEVNEDTRRVASENAREVVETREWVGGVFERLQRGDGEEEEKLKGLAAGVLVKCGEVMEKWERLMVGEMMDY
ncbi:ISWI chromatin-remodeling complex ATPase ISW2 [Sphaceloma murrayae]|uniref:ISWI chromatin-remodeling complex ATPase ISW2 n=1 Tax=Sphaceloma murrayae TaxID=2082308 RepID=A0A2K1R0U5_9PEZI|nr:ISWI chromatin-remodeling complex ATPase ISW2 [Sphaceloma murrayae]